ncbi:odorant receptor 14 [Diachasma alloeum]|uniref:Odorant receptor n=1 Tax=Diachasma alloeum TaxID=454923 RepID=A0A4E0S133_9HYME|nr:odorant receptor 14 [Diachasma alloeum]THK33040.1 odorant receptor 14 [Diachasma alloeum]
MSVDKATSSSEEVKTIQLTRWLLISLGIWPFVTDNSTIIETFLGIGVQILSYGLLVFTIVPTTYHIFMREQNLDAKITLIGPICFFTTNLLKYCAIVYHREDIKQCIKCVKTDWQRITNQMDRDIMMRNVSTGRNLTIFFAIFMYSGGMFYHTFMPFLVTSQVTNVRNTSTRPLVYAGYDLAFDPYVSPVYEIVFLSHCLTAMVVHTIVTVSCNLAASFVAHACGQIQIIISRLHSLIEDDLTQDSVCVHRKMASIIQCHAKVLRFTVGVEVILREICLIEVVASTFVICLLEYYILATWNGSEVIGILTYLVLLVALSVNVFIFCFIGEKLTQQCHEASKAIYMIKWYRLPPDVAIALVLFLASAQVPRRITAGGYMDLSLNSFVKVLKTSVVYLNLLRTVEN